MEVSLKDLKELMLSSDADMNAVGMWEVGKIYHIRTVTMALLGRLKKVTDKELLLEEASWIADSGRFSDYLKDTSKADEVEPFGGDVIVNRYSLIDAVQVNSLQRGQK